MKEKLKELESKVKKIEQNIDDLYKEKESTRKEILDLKRQIGKFRYENPQPGDFWHEMFCPIFFVLDANKEENKITICSKTMDVYELEQEDVLKSFEDPNNLIAKENIRKVVSNSYTFDIEQIEVLTLEDFHERLKHYKHLLEYSVLPGRCIELVDLWKKKNG